MKQESATAHIRAAITEGRRDGGSFFGSVLAGTLLGLGIDAWLDSSPVAVIIGVLLGSYAAFARLWHEMKTQPSHPAATLPDQDSPR
ncbi:MAG TPA: AtpZ/AtpI family protein [Acidimicrobiia bacterium]|jgi:F0F1-type ATP synthase assembly protein I